MDKTLVDRLNALSETLQSMGLYKEARSLYKVSESAKTSYKEEDFENVRKTLQERAKAGWPEGQQPPAQPASVQPAQPRAQPSSRRPQITPTVTEDVLQRKLREKDVDPYDRLKGSGKTVFDVLDDPEEEKKVGEKPAVPTPGAAFEKGREPATPQTVPKGTPQTVPKGTPAGTPETPAPGQQATQAPSVAVPAEKMVELQAHIGKILTAVGVSAAPNADQLLPFAQDIVSGGPLLKAMQMHDQGVHQYNQARAIDKSMKTTTNNIQRLIGIKYPAIAKQMIENMTKQTRPVAKRNLILQVNKIISSGKGRRAPEPGQVSQYATKVAPIKGVTPTPQGPVTARQPGRPAEDLSVPREPGRSASIAPYDLSHRLDRIVSMLDQRGYQKEVTTLNDIADAIENL